MPTQMSVAWVTAAGFFSGSVVESGPAPGGVSAVALSVVAVASDAASGGVGDAGGVPCGLPSSVMSCPSTSRARTRPVSGTDGERVALMLVAQTTRRTERRTEGRGAVHAGSRAFHVHDEQAPVRVDGGLFA